APRYDAFPRRIRHPVTQEWMRWGMDYAYDFERQIVSIRVYYRPRGKPARVVRLSHRYFFPRELRALLERGGFAVERHEGTFHGSPLRAHSESQVLVCRAA